MTPTQLIAALVIVSGIIIILLTGGLEKKVKKEEHKPAPKASDPNPSPEHQEAPAAEPIADQESLDARKMNAEKNKEAKQTAKKEISKSASKKAGRPKKSKGDDLLLS